MYALGALSQHEAQTFDVHLREGCPACYAELEQFDQVVGVLGTVAAPVTPPEYLRDLLSLRIEREQTQAPPASASVLPFPEKAGAIHRKPAPKPSPFTSALLPWAVAAVLLIAFAYTFTTGRTERQSLRAALAQKSEALNENTNLKQQLAKEDAASAELAQINSVISSPQWRIIPLAGQGPAPDFSAKVYWDVQGNRWVVSADLPPAPEGKVYQVWFITPTAKISAGLISPDKTGHGFTVLQFPSNAAPLAAAAITLEPEGGSPQPTMPIYALGKVS